MDWIEGAGYKKRVLAGESELGRGSLVQIVIIGPGNEVKPHYHGLQTEFFYILKGTATLSIAGEEFEAKPGATYITKPNDMHSVKNDGKTDFELIVFKSNWRENDSYW
ncbi:cupin domain-containing protein [archaeon]|nr:cupin domain-containing protein [archaeon]